MDCYFPEIFGGESKTQKEKLLSICRKLIEEYEEKEREQEKVDNAVEVNCSVTATIERETTSKFALYAARRKRKPTRSELDSYLEDGIIPNSPDFDVLCWWKSNRSKYHILHKVARDILAIPVSTVASESAFSTSGRVISSHRSRLEPDTVEGLMCAQSWLRAGVTGEKYSLGTVQQDSDGETEDDPELQVKAIQS
ncbi:unnamed protein product [Linum tenue]|uniref:HAT C-terminal dimerisation domain-containing protein n=1 Tax=Linum tenue TaxID=586396 RepID=A0AAV0MB72_9ROSI|nr:unnamed protein product [Linum tenue]